MLVVGDKEAEAGTVSVRHRQAGDLGSTPVGEIGRKIARLAAERVNTEEASAAGGVS
jgi:threonyl-tRNA synthetase